MLVICIVDKLLHILKGSKPVCDDKNSTIDVESI